MSDQGERICPLCAEEMDLTDQQLKPCKCGYEICVWCWHHIMDMAEKDDTEGRCPACRSPYDKDKIVGMAANCERLLNEINMEKKMKTLKVKSKSSDGRKHLSRVRVIQRNLVYIVGLTLNLADEDLLQRREYFGQYGKVLKVSISRTAAGVIQQFSNDTCSVYITYSEEEEAIQCIQNVHGFVLEGRPLRACFGTTKYCHAWLRNVPCSNPDCLYLHEIGPQEDSFTKDEIISACTRNRVQQITGATNNMQWQSGNVLPPPLDDNMNNFSAKPILKKSSSCLHALSNTMKLTFSLSSDQNSDSTGRGSPPNEIHGRNTALPASAAWGTHDTNCEPYTGGLSYLNGPSKPKPDTGSSTLAFSAAATGSIQASHVTKRPPSSDGSHSMTPRGLSYPNGPSKPKLNNTGCSTLAFSVAVTGSIQASDVTSRPPSGDGSHSMTSRVKSELLKPVKQYNSMDTLVSRGAKTSASDVSSVPVNLNSQLSSLPLSRDSDDNCTTAITISSTNITTNPCHSVSEEAVTATNIEIQNLSNELSSISIDRIAKHCSISKLSNPPTDHYLIKSPQIQGSQYNVDRFRELVTTNMADKATSDTVACNSREQCDWKLHSRSLVLSDSAEIDDDVTSFDNQRLKDPEVVCHSYLPKSTSYLHASNHSSPCLVQHGEPCSAINAGSVSADDRVRDNSILHASNILCNGHLEKLVSSSSHGLLHEEKNGHSIQRLVGVGEAVNAGHDVAVDKGESNIISNILSMDFDAWDDSLTLLHNLAKLSGNNTNNQSGPLNKSNSSKVPSNSHSRFSFARQEESKIQMFDTRGRASYGVSHQRSNHTVFQNFAERDMYVDNLGIAHGFPTSSFEEIENLGSTHSIASSNKLSAMSRAQVSAPPGFSIPSSSPPPGFSSHGRVEQAFDSNSGKYLLDHSSFSRSSYPTPLSSNLDSAGDIEFVDPAILAVGKRRLQGSLNSPALDMRSDFMPQSNYFENDARLQLLMQRSLSPQQNLGFSEIGNTYSQLGDSYAVSSRLDQSLVSDLNPFQQLSVQQSANAVLSNGQWDRWNEVQDGNSLRVAELLRNGRLGFNKFYSGYDDSKFRMPNSGNLYSRTFGM